MVLTRAVGYKCVKPYPHGAGFAQRHASCKRSKRGPFACHQDCAEVCKYNPKPLRRSNRSYRGGAATRKRTRKPSRRRRR